MLDKEMIKATVQRRALCGAITRMLGDRQEDPAIAMAALIRVAVGLSVSIGCQDALRQLFQEELELLQAIAQEQAGQA